MHAQKYIVSKSASCFRTKSPPKEKFCEKPPIPLESEPASVTENSLEAAAANSLMEQISDIEDEEYDDNR